MVSMLIRSLAFGAALTLASLLVPAGASCMHGQPRGFPFAAWTHRCDVGGDGVVGWVVPLLSDPGTNPPATPMLRVDGLLLDLAVWTSLAALASARRRGSAVRGGPT